MSVVVNIKALIDTISAKNQIMQDYIFKTGHGLFTTA